MDELMIFLDTHPEVRPFFAGKLLELIAQTPGLAEELIPCFKNVSNELREQLARTIERKVAFEEE